MLLTLIFLGLAQALDINSVYNINELIEFTTGAVNSPSEVATELAALEIDGKKNYAEIIETYLITYPHDEDQDEKLSKLKDHVGKIDEAWEQFGQKDLDDDDKSQLGDLSRTVDELYSLFVGDRLPVQVATGKRPFMCEIKMPEQQRLRRVLQAVGLSELRAFILSLKTGEDSQKSLARTILHLEEAILATKFGCEETSDDLHICDPPEHIRGETFGEFLGLFQGVVLNVGQTDARGPGRCAPNCDAIDGHRIDRCYTFELKFNVRTHCHEKRCNGRLFSCFSTGSSIEACELPKDDDRRFSWVKNSYNQWGNPSSCDGSEHILYDISNTKRKCPTCLCICAEEDDNSRATRTISLIPQFADIQNNKVVTGVRFQERNNVFYLQIEESKMEAHMEIDSKSSKWKKLNLFKYDKKKGTYLTKKQMRTVELFANYDYKILNLDERLINLDKVKAKKGEAIVGVGLRYNDEDEAVEIQIISWPFDVKTGEFKDPVNLEDEDLDDYWITWKNTPFKPKQYKKKRFTISLADLDDPVKAPKNLRLSDPNDQVRVKTTGFRKDMAQHTIPYLDLQGATFPEQKAPLRALELFYKRAQGFGGFLSFNVVSYDLAYSFQDGMSQEDIDKYKADFDGELTYDIPAK